MIAIGAAAFLLIRSEQQISQQDGVAARLRPARAATPARRWWTRGSASRRTSPPARAWRSGSPRPRASLQAATDGADRAARGGRRRRRGPRIDEAAATVTEFSAIDKRARDYLKSGQQLMAADVIFTEGSDAAATAVRQIETARLGAAPGGRRRGGRDPHSSRC